MSGWVADPQTQPTVQNGGLAVAGMGRRFAAWIIDAIASSFLVIVPFSVAIASRAVTVNTDVIDKLANDPHSVITEPLLNINATVVWLAVAGWILLRAAYFAGFWTLFGWTLGQRLLSVDVLALEDAEKRLPVWRAIVRWLALEGVGQIATAVALALVIQVLASVPFSQTSYGAAISLTTITVDSQGRAANALSTVASWGSALWSLVLIISVATNAFKRGIHDRLSGSIVLGRPPRGWQQYEQWGHTNIPPSHGYPPTGYAPTGYPPTGYGNPPTGYSPTGYPPTSRAPGRPTQAPPADEGWSQIPPRDGPTA